LQNQSDIYAESWDAASKRVKASLEAIYSDLIDDSFFIDLTNGFAKMLNSVDAFIDGIGGVKTILMGIASIFLSSVANKIQPALMNLKHTFSVVFQGAEKQAQTLAAEMNAGISSTLNSNMGKNLSDSSQVALRNAMQMNEAKAKLQGVEQSLNATEKQRYDLELQLLKAD
jgi:ABC-type phosphate transport system ATPase subunit